MPITPKVPVALVIGVRLYREGLALALSDAPQIEVVAAAGHPSDLQGALSAAGPGPPEPVFLLDLAGTVGAPGLREFAATVPGRRIVALGISATTDDVLACAEAGAAGYVTRDHSIGDLVLAVLAVARGELVCPPGIAAALFRRVGGLAALRTRREVPELLSHRELEVVTLIERGLSNKQIAGRLFISLATVKNHVHNILEKLDAANRHDAVARARVLTYQPGVPRLRPG